VRLSTLRLTAPRVNRQIWRDLDLLHPKIRRCVSLAVFVIGMGAMVLAPLHAQTYPTRILGPLDAAVPVPQNIPSTGTKDANALQEVLSFLTATVPGSWKGMQGTGTIILPNGSATEQGSATLTVLNGDAYRLDINAPDGQRSIRIDGINGQILDADGKQHALPIATALDGLVAFPFLFTQSLTDPTISVIDRGAVTIDGQSLHRLTVVRPIFPSAPASWVSTVDLYFNTTTHLLEKSAASVQIDGADPEFYVQVVTYGDYRAVGTVMLPFSYQQTLNGQMQWTLQLASIQLAPAVDASYFAF